MHVVGKFSVKASVLSCFVREVGEVSLTRLYLADEVECLAYAEVCEMLAVTQCVYN